MKKKPGKAPENRPVLIEVPKPVNQMSKKELDGFVDEILEAIDGQDSTTSCPQCSSQSGLREIFYGLPDGPVDEDRYAIGGCCVTDNDPTLKCVECGWKGEFKNRNEDKKKVVHMVKLESTEGMSDSDIDEYAKKLWGKLSNDGKGWSDDGNSKR